MHKGNVVYNYNYAWYTWLCILVHDVTILASLLHLVLHELSLLDIFFVYVPLPCSTTTMLWPPSSKTSSPLPPPLMRPWQPTANSTLTRLLTSQILIQMRQNLTTFLVCSLEACLVTIIPSTTPLSEWILSLILSIMFFSFLGPERKCLCYTITPPPCSAMFLAWCSVI